MDYILPPINLVGTFKLKPPLDNLINPKVTYKVINIRTIPALLDEEVDVETLVYLQQGLSNTDYLYGLENKIPIVTLQTEGEAVFEIPSNYFANVPEIHGKIFKNKAIVLNLGYLPDEVDIEFIRAEITDRVTALTGIAANSSSEEISGKYIVEHSEYDTWEATRQSNIMSRETCSGMLETVMTKLEQYKLKVATLVTKIENNCP